MLGIIWFRKVWLDLPEVTLELYSELIVIPLPSFREPYQTGAHEAIHQAQKPYVGKLQGVWSGTGDELIEASGRGLASVANIRGDLRIPSTGEVLAADVTPSQAFKKLREWFDEARRGCEG